ncbi:unnamed protein product, partial [Nesidiocoris tenuis]
MLLELGSSLTPAVQAAARSGGLRGTPGTAGLCPTKTTARTLEDAPLRLEDVEGASQSSFNRVPRNVGCLGGLPYLEAALPLCAKRLLAQTRLAGLPFCRVYLNRLCIKFSADRNCQVCDLTKPDTSEHLIAECAVFRAEGLKFL